MNQEELKNACERMQKIKFPSKPKDLQNRVGKWASKAFPHSDNHAKIEHIRDEIKELKESPNDPFEAADIYLILLHLAHSNAFNLMEHTDAYPFVKTVQEAIQNIENALNFFESLESHPANVHVLAAISGNIFRIASILNFDLFDVAEKKFALVQERTYGKPDERGVSHHIVKAQGEL